MTTYEETAPAPSHAPASAPCRRTVVATIGAAGLAAALTACGSDDKNSPGPAGDGPSKGGGGDGRVLAGTSDIPVGGGKIFKDAEVVVTQPTKGQFKAFSSICTHKGCPVTGVEGGTINCPCHGSKFDITDGSVRGGPAPKPLPTARIVVAGGSIKLA
ncbi:Rieske (2Fe-2S) protein [Streptomyces atriruber]|uniref:Cytochrome bc1 complex Rieske iron-sulfur subunit n=1 Tax=Streptomyces atriruber TaxID=545121 RepID=A0ABV3BY33_9ACTN